MPVLAVSLGRCRCHSIKVHGNGPSTAATTDRPTGCAADTRAKAVVRPKYIRRGGFTTATIPRTIAKIKTKTKTNVNINTNINNPTATAVAAAATTTTMTIITTTAGSVTAAAAASVTSVGEALFRVEMEPGKAVRASEEIQGTIAEVEGVPDGLHGDVDVHRPVGLREHYGLMRERERAGTRGQRCGRKGDIESC